MYILVLNAGSSSLKCSLYNISGEIKLVSPQQPLWEEDINWNSKSVDNLLQDCMSVLQSRGQIDIVGHRIVHSGSEYTQPTLITDEVKSVIEKYAPLAPSHNPASLKCIEIAEKLFPQAKQIAVFDTDFHKTLPDAAAIYPGPYEWVEMGIRKYGFHGINHKYCAHKAAKLVNKDMNSLRIISCHLGNGASLAAIKNGVSIDTTMGFTPLDGLMMGSRSGSIDPGILIYLIEQKNESIANIKDMLTNNSGLKGISGISGDMREIINAVEMGNARAKLAFDIYVHRLHSCLGSMLASLGGLDLLIFTGGIGENSAAVRTAACKAFSFLNLTLDEELNNESDDRIISSKESSVEIVVIKAQEDWAIAVECYNYK